MPKRVHEINPFHGGINTKDDQRDISETQLVEALNVKADSKGTLKIIGNPVSGGSWTSGWNSTANVYPGYGLFRFSSDADASGNSGTDDNNTDFLIAWSEYTQKLYWYDGSSWAEALDLTSWTSASQNGGGKPVFSYANGSLRVCDSNFNNTGNQNYWLGYIDRHIFKGSNAASNISEWTSQVAELSTPSTAPTIKTSLISGDSDTSAEDISWVGASARLNTTQVASLADNADNYTISPSSGDNEYTAQPKLYQHPFGESDRILALYYTADLSGENIWSGSGYVRLSTSNGIYFDSSFTLPTSGSIYLSAKLEDQRAFDAWNGGYAHSSETKVTFRNLKIKAYNSASSTTNYISWNVPVSKLSLSDTSWFVLELPYDEASENNLSGTTINQIEWAWDTTVEKSGSDSVDASFPVLSVADMRTGDKGQVGNDLFGNHKYAYSFTYDDKKSESLLQDIGEISMGIRANSYSPLFQVGARSFSNKRISGAVLYVYEEDTPYMIAELDFVKGLRGGWETEWPGTDSTTTQWTSVGSSSVKSNVIYNESIPLVESYQSRNGYSHKQDSIDARYKSIVITNNRAYVGNVYIDGTHYPDRMIKSQAFDYDAFPEEGRNIEVVKQDGDSIVKLAAYADRLFQFKRNKLHVINITSEQEFLEDSYTGLGVDYPYRVTEMSSGIAWINENGAYYFNGKNINNITNGLISDNDWADFITNGGARSQIFYSPKQDKLIAVGGNSGKDIYEYTIHTGGWTRGENIFDDAAYTNFALDVDNSVKVLKPSTGSWYTWSDDSTASKSDYEIITGDLVFDSSAVRKKIYSVHVTHKGLGAAKSLKCYGRADRAGTWTPLGQLDNYTDFTVQEFDVSGVNNARSYQVKLEYFDSSNEGEAASTIPSGFEINDINVVFRSKNVR